MYSNDADPALALMGHPGDRIRIVPRSDPDNFYDGHILKCFTNEGVPFAYLLLQPQAKLQQIVPWDAIESVTFMEFASPDSDTPEETQP